MPQKRTTTTENGSAAFFFAPRWVWVAYPAHDLIGEELGDDEAFHGFQVEVLTNLSGYQQRAHDTAFRAYIDAIRPDGERVPKGEDLERAEDDYLRSIAYRVRSWNWREQDVNGEVVAMPAPGEAAEADGFMTFYYLPTALRVWLIRVIREASRPKVTTPPSSSAGTTVTVTPPSTPPAPAPPAS